MDEGLPQVRLDLLFSVDDAPPDLFLKAWRQRAVHNPFAQKLTEGFVLFSEFFHNLLVLSGGPAACLLLRCAE
jgi:hypothetical protein